jgi:hypothetical protein
MARRLQIEDRPVKPVAPPPDVDTRLNTFPPEAVDGFEITIDPAAVIRASDRQIDAVLSAPGRAMMEAAFPELAAAVVEHAEAMRATNRRVMVQRPDDIAANAAAARERARLEQEEARTQVRASTDRSDLAMLFQPAAPKPTIDVRGALAFLAGKSAAIVELHAVAADMVSRGGRFTSQRQFEYAKAICNKPRNRRLLRDEYDLTALEREDWAAPAQQQQTQRATTFGTGVRAGFECLITGATPHAVTITFAYAFEGRQSVRSVAVPANRIIIKGQVGDRVRCSVDAEWLLAERRIDARLIPSYRLHGGGAAAAGPIRRRVRS